MMRARIALLATSIAVAGCTPVEMRDGQRAASHICRNGPPQHYLGQAADAGVIEGARRSSGARTVRVVRPGEAVTMDFRPDRLTITVDPHRVISRLSCG